MHSENVFEEDRRDRAARGPSSASSNETQTNVIIDGDGRVIEATPRSTSVSASVKDGMPGE